MVQRDENPGAHMVDDWVSEAGEESVIAILREEQRRCNDGEYPSFTDPEALLAHWNRGRRQSA